jgi:cytochrome c-type biogenesis protein CcmH
VTRAVLVVLAAWAMLGPASIPVTAAAPVDDDQVREIGAELRCVVCQNLSVADSPSETAQQMRQIIRERLAGGDTPEQVKAYFVEKYGLWILLAPPRQGFNLLVWVVPFIGLAIGLVIVAIVIARWRRRTAAVDTAPEPAAALDETMRQRIRREVAELDR